MQNQPAARAVLPAKNAEPLSTIEEWRDLESLAIESQTTFEASRRSGGNYLLRGQLKIVPTPTTSSYAGSRTTFGIEVWYKDSTRSGFYQLTLQRGSGNRQREVELEQLLIGHNGAFVDGFIGGHYKKSHGFTVNYISTPAVAAVVKKIGVCDIQVRTL